MKNPMLIDIPELIKTPRLTLQVPKAGMGEPVHAAIMDGYEDYVRWLAWPATPPTVEEVELDCRRHRAEFILREPSLRYVITDNETGAVLGRCAFFPSTLVRWQMPQFAISCFIRKSGREHGHATEAAHALSVVAFRVLGAQKVEIFCEAENPASPKAARRLGFVLECTQRGGFPRPDGQLAELQTWAVFSEDQLPALEITW